MTTTVVYHPSWQPVAPRPAPVPLSFDWLALALALGIIAVAVSHLMSVTGILAAITAYALAILPCTIGLGIALGFLALEIVSCHKK